MNFKVIQVLAFFSFFSFEASNAQIFSGTWIGGGIAGDQEAYMELKLIQSGSQIHGESFLLFKRKRFQRFAVEGEFNSLDSSVQLRELKILEINKGLFDIICFSEYQLILKREKNGFLLTGNNTCKTRGFIKLKATALAEFTRKDILDSSEIKIENNPDSMITQLPVSNKNRPEQTIKTFNTSEEIIRGKIYDNGEIDGDSVSLYFNGILVANKLLLTDKPYNFEIVINKKEIINKLLFVAHNLGSIPPNTGTISLEIEGKIHRIFFSSDLEMNAAVEFIYKSKNQNY